MIDGFDWNSANQAKCQKHGVSIEEIESLFQEEMIVFPDPSHSEERLRGIGKTASGRYVFIVWTIRQQDGQSLIRPISVRYMHRKEVHYYENL